MKKSKKLLSLALSVVMAASAFTACSTNNPASTDDSSAAAGGGTSGNSGEVRTVTMLGSDYSSIWDNREQHQAYQELMKMFADHNLNVEFEIVTNEQYQQVLQTRVASATNMPDMLRCDLDVPTTLNLGNRGVLLDVKGLMEEYGNGNVDAFASKYFPDMWKGAMDAEGKAYWLPINQVTTYKGEPFFSLMTALVRQDWVDKLGMEMPTTLEEYKNLLIAFQENDMNGNGKKDEKILYQPSFSYIAPSFGLPGGVVAVDTYSHVAASPWHMTEEMTEFVTYVKELIDLGLVDLETWDKSGDVSTQKIQANQISSVFSYAMATWYDAYVKDYGGVFNPVMLGKTEGEIPWTISEPPYVSFGKIAISSECKDKQAVADLIDMCFTDEYATLDFYGIEGVSHTVVDGIRVFDPNFKNKDFYTNQATGTQLWFTSGMPINHIATQEGYINGEVEPKKTVMKDFTEKYCIDGKYYCTADYQLAPPTIEEAETLAKISNDINTYSKEMLTKLCLGQEPIESIPKHAAVLDEMGLKTMIEIYQARHDRFING